MTDSKPLLVLLQDQGDSTEFWTQQEVLVELRSELLLTTGVSHNLNAKEAEGKVALTTEEAGKKRGWFSRSSKPPCVSKSPVDGSPSALKSDKVQVSVSEVYVRRESAFGLFETVTVQAILVKVVLE